MARPSNADILSGYQTSIRKSKEWRKQEQSDDTWQRLIDMYRGRHYDSFSTEDRILVNVAFATINVIAPSVSVNNPKIAVNAIWPEAAPMALITEAVINHWWKRYEVKPQFRRAVKDFLIVGHGWLKSGYKFVEESYVIEGDGANTPGVDNVAESTTVVLEDRPFVDRVSPFDMFVDPDATSMADLRWIAQRIRRPLNAVKRDKRYSATARGQVTAPTWKKNSTASGDKDVYDKQQEYVEVWEFYDLVRGTVSVFTEGESFLIAPKAMPYAFGHPFTMLRNYDIPDEFYPMGDLEAIEPLQRELNETRTQMMNHRKKFARKYLYRKDRFDTEGREALESDVDNTMVPTVGDQPLLDAVTQFPSLISPPEFYNQSSLIRDDMTNVSGVSEYQAGGMPEIRRTATEAGIIADASNARAADKLATIESAIGSVAKHLIALAQQYMTQEQVVRFTGPNSEPVWVKFTKDHIAGEFDFDVEGGSTAPTNESFRRQSALQMVDALAPFIQAGVIDPQKVVEHVLQFGFGVKDPGSFMAQPGAVGPDGQPLPPEAQQGMPPEGMPPDGMSPQQPMPMGAPGADASPFAALPPELLAQLSAAANAAGNAG